MNPKLIDRKTFDDDRGSFSEAFRASDWNEKFVQDNISISKFGVLRGLHHQTNNPQGKFVSVIFGTIKEVVVNLETREVHYFDLNMGDTLWVPPNYLHGFLSLSHSVVFYKCTNYYDEHSDLTVNAFDESLDINWGLKQTSIIRSAKDSTAKNFDEVFL